MGGYSAARMLLVVGAGIVGLACAEEVSRRGHSVRVLERRSPGGEASWAAGGMLAADYESDGPGPFADFAAASRALWPELAERLVAGFHDVGFRREGTLAIARDEAQLARLKARLAWLDGANRKVEWLSDAEARKREPALGAIAGAAFLPDDGVVHNRAVLLAQMAILRARNVEITAHADATLWIESGTLRGVIVAGEKIAGTQVINAAGAWAGEIAEGLPRFTPVRGQMVQFPRPDGSLARPVRWEDGYAIPRGAQIVVGSTVELDSGFDKRTTPEAIAALGAGFHTTLPALAAGSPTHAWAGLRPRSADGLPVIGPSKPFPNLLYAAGLYRNGILLAAATARAIGDLADGRAPTFPIAAFDPGRESLRTAGAIVLNGAARVIAPLTTVGSLLAELALKKQGVAVAVNEEVVRRGDWDSTRLNDHDRVEIIHAVGGG